MEAAGDEGLLNVADGRRESVPTEAGNYGAFFDGLYRAIRLGDAVPVPAREGWQVMRVIEAAEESHRTRSAGLAAMGPDTRQKFPPSRTLIPTC